MIARSQRPDPRLLQTETSSTALPERLIDVGLDDTHPPRLVDTAGQTGCYVALSHCSGSRKSSETQLTLSNMSRLQQSIKSSETSRSVFDAINLTRSLGMRYLWVDTLCVVQDDPEGLSKMSDIYRSAAVTIVPTRVIGVIDAKFDSCIDSSGLEQPFLIFLDWSRPTVARSCLRRLSSPSSFSRLILQMEEYSELVESLHGGGKVNAAHETVVAFLANRSGNSQGDILKSDGLYGAEPVKKEVELNDTRFDEAEREIDQGVRHVEAGKNFEALALFMKVKELVSAFQKLTRKSWKLHAVASANIALVYQMQHLPDMAHDIAEASLALQSRLPEGECSCTFE